MMATIQLPLLIGASTVLSHKVIVLESSDNSFQHDDYIKSMVAPLCNTGSRCAVYVHHQLF